jgi:hypothetical protein
MQKVRLILHHAECKHLLLTCLLLFLQLMTDRHQNLRVGHQVVCSDFADTGLLLRAEDRLRAEACAVAIKPMYVVTNNALICVFHCLILMVKRGINVLSEWYG